MIDPETSTGAPTVLYIAGVGRSGSTLLDTLLGQLDGFVSVGELRNLWLRGLTDGWPCGCGAPVRECPFWSAVLEAAFGSAGSVSVEAMRELQAHTVRTRHLPALWWSTAHGPSDSVKRYGEVLSRLYHGIAEVSGARVVVDSSKHPSDALVASTLKGLELYVLHLVRDPRGVAFSVVAPQGVSTASRTPWRARPRCAARCAGRSGTPPSPGCWPTGWTAATGWCATRTSSRTPAAC